MLHRPSKSQKRSLYIPAVQGLVRIKSFLEILAVIDQRQQSHDGILIKFHNKIYSQLSDQIICLFFRLFVGFFLFCLTFVIPMEIANLVKPMTKVSLVKSENMRITDIYKINVGFFFFR